MSTKEMQLNVPPSKAIEAVDLVKRYGSGESETYALRNVQL